MTRRRASPRRPRADMTEAEIRTIVRLYRAGDVSLRALAARFNTTKGVIERILKDNNLASRDGRQGRADGMVLPADDGGGPRPRTCQFPLWGNDLPPLAQLDDHKCGAPVKPGSPYCPDHHARCRRHPDTPTETDKGEGA